MGIRRRNGSARPVRRRRRLGLLALALVLLAAGVITIVVVRDGPAPERSRVSPYANQWVQRQGSTLELAGRPWRPAGVNMYWLGLDDNGAGPHYPSHAAVDAGYAAAADLGATLVRSTSLGVSVGSPRTLEPVRGKFNDRALDSVDYAVAQARRWGLRLMIPLTDQGHYYTGGKHVFTSWAGHADLAGKAPSDPEQIAQEAAFYTDGSVIADFRDYVEHLLDHVNPITHLRLGSDPTIAVWETGNELYDAPTSWTDQTAMFIKSLAPRALVADGAAATGVNIDRTAYQSSHVDIIDAHYYPVDITTALAAADFVRKAGKAFLVGEYPLTGPNTAQWLSALAQDRDVCGDLAWSLLPTVDGKPEQHDDGYTFHFPGATADERHQTQLLQRHLSETKSR